MSGVGSSPSLATCETSQVLLVGVSGGFPGVLPFRPTYRDWLVSMSDIILKGTLNLITKTSSPKGNDRSPENKQVFSNSSRVSIRFFQLVNGSQLCSPWLDQILTSIKGCNSVANLQKK